jgi:hypothetical protein
MQQGMAALTSALELLQKSLPQLPMGSKLHTAVLKAVSDIGKNMAEEGGGAKDQSAIIQQLVDMARQAKVNPASPAALPGAGGGPPPMMEPPGGGPPMGI